MTPVSPVTIYWLSDPCLAALHITFEKQLFCIPLWALNLRPLSCLNRCLWIACEYFVQFESCQAYEFPVLRNCLRVVRSQHQRKQEQQTPPFITLSPVSTQPPQLPLCPPISLPPSISPSVPPSHTPPSHIALLITPQWEANLLRVWTVENVCICVSQRALLHISVSLPPPCPLLSASQTDSHRNQSDLSLKHERFHFTNFWSFLFKI